MRLLSILALAFALHAEDAPKPTSEQEVVELRKQLSEAQAEIRLYQQGMFQCQAANIHNQAAAEAQRPKPQEKPAK